MADSHADLCAKHHTTKKARNRLDWSATIASANLTQDCLPLYTKISCAANGRYHIPPPNVALSDELVYIVTKQCGRNWPNDFDRLGSIHSKRVPKGPAPLIFAHGLPFFPVWRGFYALIGGEAATTHTWLIDSKSSRKETPRGW